MNILAQRDPRWKDIKIGKSNSTIGNYGCTMCCLSMLANITPDIFNSKMTAVNGFQGDLIIWTKINELGLNISYDNGRSTSYNNDKVKEAIEKNGGCLVEVDFDNRIETPNDRHWILFIGNERAYDPWLGKEVATTQYPLLKGFCVINVKNFIENGIIPVDMTEEQKRIIDFLNGKTEGEVREAFGALQDKSNLIKEVDTLKLSLKTLEDRIDQLEADSKANNDLIDGYQSQLLSAKSKESKLQEEIESLKSDVNTWKNRYESKLKETVDKYSAWELIKIAFKKLSINK
jgi:hypothetical protein